MNNMSNFSNNGISERIQKNIVSMVRAEQVVYDNYNSAAFNGNYNSVRKERGNSQIILSTDNAVGGNNIVAY